MWSALLWLIIGAGVAMKEASALKARGSRLEMGVFVSLLVVGTSLLVLIELKLLQFSMMDYFYYLIEDKLGITVRKGD